MTIVGIDNEIKEIIKKPTVVMCKDGSPIEYRNTAGVRKIKHRDIEDKLSVHLIMYVATKGGAKESLQKFSSGDFARFLSLYKIYNS